METEMEMDNSMSVAVLSAGLSAGVVLGSIHSWTRTLRQRAACLIAADSATNEFYDVTERLLADPSVPDRLKRALYDLTLAVTDRQAGPVVFDAMLRWIEAGRPEGPGSSGLASEMEELRTSRGDLYDDFNNASRSAIASLMFAYGPGHSKVVVEFEATRNQSIVLALVARIDRVISDWIAGGGGARTARA